MESFYIGISVAFVARTVALRWLKYPQTSMPLRSIKPILLTGIFFSTLDLFRRVAIQRILQQEQRKQVSKQFRKDDRHYDL